MCRQRGVYSLAFWILHWPHMCCIPKISRFEYFLANYEKHMKSRHRDNPNCVTFCDLVRNILNISYRLSFANTLQLMYKYAHLIFCLYYLDCWNVCLYLYWILHLLLTFLWYSRQYAVKTYFWSTFLRHFNTAQNGTKKWSRLTCVGNPFSEKL